MNAELLRQALEAEHGLVAKVQDIVFANLADHDTPPAERDLATVNALLSLLDGPGSRKVMNAYAEAMLS